MKQAPETFSRRLIEWQKRHGRHDLPWQRTRDPYRIWLSEIMLQQTQVATVIPYYQRFLERFPDVAALAAAPLAAVIEAWAGLGYYARARNLHRCAQRVMEDHGGRFPATPEELAGLPGIGPSTAAAIAAFAWGRRAAILDGNVKRVFCRHFGIEGVPGTAAADRALWALADSLLPEDDMEAYTQGLMDLGATVCTRPRPACGLCPLQATCVAYRQGRQAELPARRPRPALPERETTLVLISDGQHILFERRPPAGIWGGLLVPPEGEPAAVLARLGLHAEDCLELPPLLHVFTHFRLHIRPVLCRVAPDCHTAAERNLEWLAIGLAPAAGVPTPVKKLVRLVASAGD
ncbi:MAG: mutY [Rhodocyclaceae bacterium]|nr:mutY [Rhodocyclaceae bacterium]